MNTRSLVASMFLAISAFGSADAEAQGRAADAPQDAPYSVVGMPDACKLLPQSDLQALFPGRPIESKGPTLSPIYKGPQYNEGCMYIVKLPSPTSSSDIPKFASIHILSWGTQSENPVALAKNFARFRKSSEDVAAKLSFPKRVEPVQGVGDEAFQEITEHNIAIRIIKDDLFFSVTLDTYSPQSEPNAVALAAQAANRWRGGVGMVEPASPIKPSTSVDIPPDTRVSKTPPVDRWPDACALLTLEDVYTVFGDMNVSQPRKTMGKVTHFSRVDRVEEIPNPIGCSYDAHKTEVVDGKRDVITNTIGVRVVDVSLTPEAAKKSFGITQKVGGADTPVPGLGDEATLSIMNEIYMRKGAITVSVRVGGGQRDKALHADARTRVLALAKMVSAKLP
jgi:hypothetical protein